MRLCFRTSSSSALSPAHVSPVRRRLTRPHCLLVARLGLALIAADKVVVDILPAALSRRHLLGLVKLESGACIVRRLL